MDDDNGLDFVGNADYNAGDVHPPALDAIVGVEDDEDVGEEFENKNDHKDDHKNPEDEAKMKTMQRFVVLDPKEQERICNRLVSILRERREFPSRQQNRKIVQLANNFPP